MKKLFLILILLTVTFNCSSVQTTGKRIHIETTGVIDNDYNNYKINRLAIFVNIKNLNNRSNYELQLYEILDQFFIERCRSIDVLPPIRDYTDKEYKTILNRYDLDTF
jgi:dUTPase